MSTFESLSPRACDLSAVTGTVLCNTKVKSRSAPPTCPKWRFLASEVAGRGAAKRKGHLVRYSIKSKKKMLSVHNPNAEETLDAGIIKSASRPAHPRRRDTGRRNYQIRVQTCASTQKRHWTQELSNPRPDLRDRRLHNILLDVTSGVRKEGSYPP